MPYKRLIPVLLVKHGMLVRSQEFKLHQVIGNPITTIHRLSGWDVDELIILDISTDEDFHDIRRSDFQVEYSGQTFLDLVSDVSKVCSMPLTVGGRITALDHVASRLELGADKCVINSAAFDNINLISDSAKKFGSQCVVAGIDVKKDCDGQYLVFKDGGRTLVDIALLDYLSRLEGAGAGEIFINSIDRDGLGVGFDKKLIEEVVKSVGVPIITCGGAGTVQHLAEVAEVKGISGISAANIFHFKELSYPNAKDDCIQLGVDFRKSTVGSKVFPREPIYSVEDRNKKLNFRRSHTNENYVNHKPKKIFWCKKCVAPSISATPLEFDSNGVCTACQMAEAKKRITKDQWNHRRVKLEKILDSYRSKDGSNYDCIIAVSGGKDSFFQTHVLKNQFGMNPLLVTYNGNNWLPVGWRNMLKMKEVFDCDHLLVSPRISLLKKLNKLGFEIMGDMNWHAHVGISTVPMMIGAKYNIPLVFYGEHGYTELGGQFSLEDFPEASYRYKLEHFARGYELNYFVGLEGITTNDMILYKYPSDEIIKKVDLRGLFLGNYIYWEANEHTKMVIDSYGFEVNTTSFDRTYRKMSNLDDMHENGAHDYLKYIKFGYGRCTDHVCKDIRAGLLTREEGIHLVKKYDHVKPVDLKRWYEYSGVTEDDFDRIADSFRDPRVWSRINGEWMKQNIWDSAI